MVRMDLPGLTDTPPPGADHWTAARMELAAWFRRHAPAIAELYEAAVELTYGRELPAWPRLVCHAMREIGNRLPEAILGPVAKAKSDAGHRIGDLVDAWRHEGYPTDGSLPLDLTAGAEVLPSTSDVPVSARIVQVESEMVRDYVAGLNTRREAAETFFEELTPDDEVQQSRLRLLADEWRAVMKWAVSNVHVPNTGKSPDPDSCRSRFEMFEKIIGHLIWDFFTTAGEIDELLDAANAR